MTSQQVMEKIKKAIMADKFVRKINLGYIGIEDPP